MVYCNNTVQRGTESTTVMPLKYDPAQDPYTKVKAGEKGLPTTTFADTRKNFRPYIMIVLAIFGFVAYKVVGLFIK